MDYNKQQLDGYLNEICEPFSFVEKAKSFGLDAVMIKGDDIDEIRKYSKNIGNNPMVIVLDTVKGQGIKFIEKFNGNHHIRANDKIQKELEKALEELESSDN
ncbi:hypothetical protein [Caviibacter abscessus]|uniref:hypothetical protein n=1 Tax=Caviibacter abscessus TaxID=1766719 RepID=UPI000A3E0117|nr:hypothetical protein [Caviibacter abscessus]